MFDTPQTKNGKIKYLFHLSDTKVLYMAGIWNRLKDRDGNERNRFVILTTA